MHLKCANVNGKVKCPNNYVLKTIESFRLPMNIILTILVVNSEIKSSNLLTFSSRTHNFPDNFILHQ